MTLTQKKREATKQEYARVYDNFNLPPRDIYVEHDGERYEKRAWQNLRSFGWDKWKKL